MSYNRRENLKISLSAHRERVKTRVARSEEPSQVRAEKTQVVDPPVTEQLEDKDF